jgi:dTDP-4-amino-4,6-dideoxygalactose transaminase
VDAWSEKRRLNAEFYTKRLAGEQWSEGLIFPPVVKQERHVFNQYVIRAERRDRLKAFLDGRGIGSEIYYPNPLHKQECVAKWLGETGRFPFSEEAAESVLALPIYPELTEAQQEYVLSKIGEFYTSQS